MKELAKHIYITYVTNICINGFFVYPKFQGLPVIPSASADEELAKLNLCLQDVVKVLDEGFDCERSRRKKGTLEKCICRGKKTLKVVVVKSHNYSLETDCWLLIHVGVF